MNHELKFRAWEGEDRRMYDPARTETLMALIGWTTTKYQYLQSTGLLDCNGKEIYEGDIVTPGKPNICWKTGEVQYRNGAFRVHAFLLCQLSRCHVVGNVYENPELLENPND